MGRKKLTKHETTGELQPVKSLYELVGIASHSYGTTKVDEYENSLRAMNMADLQDHAIVHGFPAKDDRERLIDTLIKKFLTEMGQLQAASLNKQEPEKRVSKDLKAILNRGK